MLRIHDGQWVLPEMYDMQQNISYLIIHPIINNQYIKRIDKLWNLEHIIYHILNIKVTEFMINSNNINNSDEYNEWITKRTTYLDSCKQCIFQNPTDIMINCQHTFDFNHFCFDHYDAFCDRNNSRIAKPFYFVTIWDENIGVLILYLMSIFCRYYNYNYHIAVDDISIYFSILIDLFVFIFIIYNVYVYYNYYNSFYYKKTKDIKFWMHQMLITDLFDVNATSFQLYDIITASIDSLVSYFNDRLCYEMTQFLLVENYHQNYQMPSYIVDIIIAYIVADFGEGNYDEKIYSKSYDESHIDILKGIKHQIEELILNPAKQYCMITDF